MNYKNHITDGKALSNQPAFVYEEPIVIELPYNTRTPNTFLYHEEDHVRGEPLVKVWLPKRGNIRHPTPTIKVTIEFIDN